MSNARRPVGRLVFICRDYLHGPGTGVASTYRVLLPALARLGADVSVLCESRTGVSADNLHGRVDVHALTVRDNHTGLAYFDAAMWAQCAGDWIEHNAIHHRFALVEAPESRAEGLHMRERDIPMVVRACDHSESPAWLDEADPIVMAAMERESTAQAVMTVSTSPRTGRQCVVHPLARFVPRAARVPGQGKVVVVAAQRAFARVVDVVDAVHGIAPERDIVVVGADEATMGRWPANRRIRAVEARSTAALHAVLDGAAVGVLLSDACVDLAVEALAGGIPVITDAPIDEETLRRPDGLVRTETSSLAERAARAVGDVGLAAAAAAQAPELRRRWSPLASADALLESFVAVRGNARRVPADAGKSMAASFRFPADGEVSIAIDGTAEWAVRALQDVRRTMAASATVTVVGPRRIADLPGEDVLHVGATQANVDALCAIAAARDARVAVGVAASTRFDDGWVDRLKIALGHSAGSIGIVVPYPSGYRVTRLPGGGVALDLQPRWISTCDVVMGPVVCMLPHLAGAIEIDDPLERALVRARRARDAGYRVIQADIAVNPRIPRPQRLLVSSERVAELEAAGHDLNPRVIDFLPQDGFSDCEMDEGVPFWWTRGSGTLWGNIPGPGVWELTFVCQSFAEDRTVSLTSSGSDVALGVTTPVDRTRFSHRFEADAGPFSVSLAVSGAPVRPVDINPASDDVRPLSARISYPVMERVG